MENKEKEIEILVSYFNGDGEFKRKNKFTGESDDLKKKEEGERKYKKWKQEFLTEQKREKTANIKKAVLSILITASILFIAYYWYIGELQFIGQKTEFTKAKVVNVQMHHIGRGYYMQTVTYEFDYNNKTYYGTFEAGKRTGKQKPGNYIKIKFSASHPDRSKMVGIYKNN